MFDMIIFDMDGVILDSEPLHEKARIMISEENNIFVSNDVLPDPVGKSSAEFWQIIFDICGITDKSPVEFEKQQFELVGKLAVSDDVGCNPGLITLLDWCKENNIIMGVASSSNRPLIEYILDGLNIKHYFSYIVAGEEAARRKPAPDIYLKVLELSGIPKERACAIEDSAAGIEAAKAAGLYCFGYSAPSERVQDQSKADKIITRLDAICNL